MGPSIQTARRRIGGFLLAFAVSVSLGGVMASASAPPGDSTDPLTKLAEADALLREALTEGRPDQRRSLLFRVNNRLGDFTRSFFDGERRQQLYGCDPFTSSRIFEALATLDAELAWALNAAGDRRGRLLGHATSDARAVLKSLRDCPDAGSVQRTRARLILDRAAKLWARHMDGSLPDHDLRADKRRIHGWKVEMLGGHKLLSCDAGQMHVAIDAAVTPAWLALFTRNFKKRSKLIAKAQEALAALVELWRSCGSDCIDTLDNDGDFLRDAADPGCQTGFNAAHDPRDMSEQDFDPDADPPGIGCPTIPTAMVGPRNSFIRQPNEGTTMERIILRNITTGLVLVERTASDSDFAAGSAQLGDGVCGPGTTASVEWSVEGLDVVWRIHVAKNAPAVTPGINRVVVAANTR